MSFDRQSARAYVKDLDLSGVPRLPMAQGGEEDAKTVFDDAQRQCLVVGPGIFAFEKGISPIVREAISDAALLAQLVASKRVDAEAHPLEWFKEYGSVLANVGWTLQQQSWVDYSTRGTSAQVHEKILEVATTAFAGSPALALITALVNSLKAMNPSSPWLTIFDRESQKARISRFQVGFTSTDDKGDVMVALLGCLIEAQSNITQVLFFKFKDAKASFRANSAEVSINKAAITELADAIRTKTRAYQSSYLSGIVDI